MGKKELDRSEIDVAGVEELKTKQLHADSMLDIPEFTPEQWEWLKEQTAELEKGYVPTRSIIPEL